VEASLGEPEAADRCRHWQLPRHLRAYLFALVIRSSVPPGILRAFSKSSDVADGLRWPDCGSEQGDLLNLAALGGVFGGEKQGKKSYKILDTSVIIDGRIADIAETGFLDGIIVTPQFFCASSNLLPIRPTR